MFLFSSSVKYRPLFSGSVGSVEMEKVGVSRHVADELEEQDDRPGVSGGQFTNGQLSNFGMAAQPLISLCFLASISPLFGAEL